jgi:hypothetical protein
MASWKEKTYHLKGIEILNGQLSLNDNPLHIGDWSIETGADGDLLIKNDKTIQAKISCHSNVPKKIDNDRFFITDPIDIDECIGLLVSNTNKYYNFDFTQAPTVQQSLPTIQITKKECDPAILGVISGCENFTREYEHGAFKTVYAQDDGINRVIVSTKGLGSMWVIDRNGTLKNGDFITSSNISGYGMKQTPENIYYNFTWGKIMQDCDFSPELKVLQQPVDFTRDGPVYQALLNSEGKSITDYEYKMKFITLDGQETTRLAFENELQNIIDDDLINEDNKSLGDNENINTDRDWIDRKERALKIPARKVYRACLVGYQR